MISRVLDLINVFRVFVDLVLACRDSGRVHADIRTIIRDALSVCADIHGICRDSGRVHADVGSVICDPLCVCADTHGICRGSCRVSAYTGSISSDGILYKSELFSYAILAKFKFRFICSDLFMGGFNLTFDRYYIGVVTFHLRGDLSDHVF